MNKINNSIGLCGEYRLVVRDNATVVSDTGWCKNTILSGGLEFLSTNSILNGITFLDLGTSPLSSNNYTLSGVITPCIDTSLTNISSANVEYYKLNKSTQVYYSIFSSNVVLQQAESVNEFCVKTTNKTGFSRAVLPEPVQIRIGQNINFEYRVSVDHSSQQEANVEFTTPDNSSFYIPVTSKTFNIPNDERNKNRIGKLVDYYTLSLSENNDALPLFGETYPNDDQPLTCGVGVSTALSRFTPSIVYSGLDDTTRQYSVITLYNNISAPNDSGVFSNINSAILKYDTQEFHVTRFAFPLVVYNTTLFSNATSINTGNLLSLYYSYTWGENLDSPFTTPITFSLSSPQLIPCNINAEVDLYPDSFVTLFSDNYTSSSVNGNTTIIRVNLKGTTLFKTIKVDYSSPQLNSTRYPYGPSPYRLLMYSDSNQILDDTGYVFNSYSTDWPYPYSQSDSLAFYNTQLYSKTGQSIQSSTPNTYTLTDIPSVSGNGYIDMIVNSPLRGTSWKVILDTRAESVDESSCTETVDTVNLCVAVTVDYGITEHVTLSGSLVSGSYTGLYLSSIPVEVNWSDLSGWSFTYDGLNIPVFNFMPIVPADPFDRCYPIGLEYLYDDGDIYNSVPAVFARIDTFGSCLTPPLS